MVFKLAFEWFCARAVFTAVALGISVTVAAIVELVKCVKDDRRRREVEAWNRRTKK